MLGRDWVGFLVFVIGVFGNSFEGSIMDGNNWRPAAQGTEASPPTAMDGRDWRTQLQPHSRQRIVNKIMKTLKRHLRVSGHEGLQELRKIAVSFEGKIYSAATSQSDYLKKISFKMLTMETKSQNSMGVNDKNPPDPDFYSLDGSIIDGNNWRPAEAPPPTAMDGQGWRTQFQPHSRQRIVNKIMETLKRHLPVSGQEGLQGFRKIAVRFEEKIYSAATSQSDYLKKISLKMLTMETKSQNSMGVNNKNPPDPASQSFQSQVNSQVQPLHNPVMANQAQARQLLLSQNIQNNVPSTGVQGSTSLTSTLPAVGNLTQTNMTNVGQNSNSQNIQNISGVTQNSVGSTMGQNMPSNIFANSQRQQIQGRQQQGVPQQQQQQPQNSQSYLYQQQLQQQLIKQKFQQGNIPPAMMQSHIQQQQQQPQQNLLQPTHLQSAQQSIMQPNVMQSTSLSGNQQNQQSSVQQSAQSMLQQHQQSVLRQQQQPQQAAIVHQQQTPMQQQPLLQAQQQQLPMGQQPNAMNMQQNQLMGQQNNFPDIQQQQQQQRLLGQQNNLSNLQPQQQQQQQQQQHMGQQNNISNMHSQQLAPQNNVASLQQQQLLGTQSGNSNMLTNQHSMHMQQQTKVSVQQQTQQSAATLLPTQGQQSQTQTQQQIMSQIQSQQGQLQQQMGLQQAPNSLRDMQQRLQTSSPLLQPQNIIDQQKQLYQSQRSIPEAPSTSLDSTAQTGNMNGGDWQEEVYQKIKAMKEMYGLELNEMYQRVANRLQQHESLPQQPKNEQVEKLKMFKVMVESIISFLPLSKSNITPIHKEKIGYYEKQIINFLNSNRPRKSIPSLQQGQLPPSHMNSMPPSQPPQSQITQVQPPDNQLNPQMQSMNTLSSVATVQPNNMTGLQHNSLSSLPGVSNAQQTMMNSLQPNSNLDPGQGNALNSLQQVAAGSLQQNSVSGLQQVNVNLSSQSGMTSLQPSLNSLQPSSNVLQQQHLKQQEQQMLQTQQLKHQFQQHQIMMHKQQLMQQQQQQQQQQQLLLQHQQQQLHQQAKQQQLGQIQPNHMSQLSQMTDANDVKIRQQMGVKSGVFQQHHSSVQRSAHHHHQLKPGAQFPISSPQLLQAASPQISQHHSPQTDQQHLLTSLTKTGTPLQSASSPFIVPSPPTPLAPSPMPGESEKVNSNVSVLSNVGNVGPQQVTAALAPAQSLAISTPGISASPLLAEFSSPDGNLNASVFTGRSSNTEQPLERLIKVVKSMSSKTLSASISDIDSVVSMIDRIAGSAPGNGSRAAVGEDLVAMTKCRLQARNFISQDGNTASRKIKRYTSAMPLNVVSSAGSINDSFKQLTGLEASDLESTATSSIKRPRIQANHALLEEIREINQRLIDTVVDITDDDVDSAAAAAEGGEGTVVKISFSAVALSPNLKSQYASAQMSPIQPLRLLVPANYPNCSPIVLDKFPDEISKEYEDLSMKAKSRFSISLRSLSQPMLLGEIARTWDVCARAVISEYAQKSGGGSFSSKYGTWENCLSAA